MDLYFSLLKKPFLFLIFLIAVILLFVDGCGDDGDIRLVDFSVANTVTRPKDHPQDFRSLRVAVAAMISPQETFVYHRQILDYIGKHLSRDIEFIQRQTYGEINELFAMGQIDLAFICSGPYALGKEKYGFDLLATPEIRGSHFYQAYLIVNRDSPFHLLEDLEGQIFAFTDPESNTGRLVPTFWLAQMEKRPENFFGKTIYTYSHDNSILAVARNLVDAASVDGSIWEYYNHKDPVFTARTRIIKKSELYGNPPLVTSQELPLDLRQRIRQLLFSMHQNPEGQRILKELMINRFIAPQDEWYDPIRRMKKKVELLKEKSYALKNP